MPDSNFYGTGYKKYVYEVSESSDKFQIKGYHIQVHISPLTLKKKCSVFGVQGAQNDRLELLLSMQKSVLKNMQ